MWSAAEFSSNEIGMGGSKDISKDKIIEIRESTGVPNNSKELNLQIEEISHNQIRSRLQDLELELSSALHSLRPEANDIAIKKVITYSLSLAYNILFLMWKIHYRREIIH